MDHYNKMDKQ